MKTTTTALMRRAGAGVSVGALVTASLLMTSVPAHAATYKTIDNLHVNTDYTRSAGHNDFLSDGVHLYTDDATSQAKAAAYFDVDMPLADAGEPNMDWATDSSTTQPGLQLVVDLDGNGTADGTLVGEPVYNGDWWLPGTKIDGSPVDPGFLTGAPEHGGGYGSDNHGTLDEWRTAFPNAEILQSGWSLGSGVHGDGTIYRITVGSTNYVFSKADVGEKTLYASDIDQSETRATGHNDFRPTGGVRVWTESNTSTDKAAGYFPVNTPLAGTGEPSLDYRHTSGGVPSVQLGVDFDGNGTQDGYLVGETIYGNDWWISNGSPAVFKDAAPEHGGGFGSDNHGTLNQWRAAFPDAQIVTGGWSLGSGLKGDGVINGITIGTTKYLFTGKNVAPSVASVTGSTLANQAVTVTLKGTDKNLDTLGYSATAAHGSASIAGDQLTFTPTHDYSGTSSFAYTANDGNGGTASSTVKITVAKRASDTKFSISPKAPTTKSNVKLNITIVAPHATVSGATVKVYDGSKGLGSGKIVRGKLTFTLPHKLKKGTHKLKVVYPGTSGAAASSQVHSVKVKK